MSYHIKRDGKLFCGADLSLPWHKRDAWITFTEAHTSKLKGCCDECKKIYFDKVSKIEPPIIV